MKIDSYSAKGIKQTSIILPKNLEEEINLELLAQAVHVYNDRAHLGKPKSKTRAEVNKTTRKIYRQKGTGSARHGAKSAPVFVGGGVSHGPKGVKRVLSLPQKMRKKALAIALTSKAKEKKLFAFDGLSSIKKSKEVKLILEKLGLGKTKVLFVTNGSLDNFNKAARNIKRCNVIAFAHINAYQVLMAQMILLDKDIFKPKRKKQNEN